MANPRVNKPRILHVYKDYYPPVMGGVEMTINLMAQGLKDRYDISVLVNSGGGRPGEEVINGIRVVKVAELGRLASAPFSPGFPLALRREAARADLLHFHHPNPTGDVARFLARPSTPAVMTYHSDVVRQQRAMRVYGPVQQWMMSRCAAIMPTSPDYLQSSEWLQAHADRCTVVPLGIELEKFAATREVLARAEEIKAANPGPRVIFVGKLRYYKGLHHLVAAMPEIPGTLLVVGGGEPLGGELREQARSLGVADRIRWVGEVSDFEKVAHLYAADIFCMPSHLRSEAFGLSQVEAMACGLPLVSTNIPSGVRFVNRDGVTGYSVEASSPGALAESINKLASIEELRRRFGDAARRRAHELFSAVAMCSNLDAVYQQVLSR